MPGRRIQSFPAHTQEFVLSHDLPQAQLTLRRALVPSSVMLWINGCLMAPDGFAYDASGLSVTVRWVLLAGDTLRVSGTPI